MSIQLPGVSGNLTADPELRFTPKGDPVASFSLAVNERIRQGNEWVDGKPEFLRVEAWGQLAENVAESLTKGTAVVVQGKLSTEEYRTRDGENRTSLKLRATHIAVDLGRQTAKVTRNPAKPSPTSPARDQQDPWA